MNGMNRPLADPQPTAQAASKTVDGFSARTSQALRPCLAQTWLNLRIWIPFLLNPDLRQRRVRYWGREHREGDTWRIGLPAQCWHCGRTEGLRSREYDVDRRGFEYPLQIVAATLGSALLLAFFAWLLSSSFLWLLTLIVVAGGVGILLLKSWSERVRLVMWTCGDHADTMPSPEYVVDQNELHVFLPTVGLAEATQADLTDERRRKGRYSGGATSGAGAEPRPRGDHPTPPPSGDSTLPFGFAPPPKSVELPPIKLSGDEDAPTADDDSRHD